MAQQTCQLSCASMGKQVILLPLEIKVWSTLNSGNVTLNGRKNTLAGLENQVRCSNIHFQHGTQVLMSTHMRTRTILLSKCLHALDYLLCSQATEETRLRNSRQWSTSHTTTEKENQTTDRSRRKNAQAKSMAASKFSSLRKPRAGSKRASP